MLSFCRLCASETPLAPVSPEVLPASSWPLVFPLIYPRATHRKEGKRGGEGRGGEGWKRYRRVGCKGAEHHSCTHKLPYSTWYTFHKRWSFGFSSSLSRLMKRVSNTWENGPCPVENDRPVRSTWHQAHTYLISITMFFMHLISFYYCTLYSWLSTEIMAECGHRHTKVVLVTGWFWLDSFCLAGYLRLAPLLCSISVNCFFQALYHFYSQVSSAAEDS